MQQPGHRAPVRHLVASATFVLLVVGIAAQSAPATAGAKAARSRTVGVSALPAAVVANAEAAPGVVVRRTAGVTVSAVAVPGSLRAAHPGVPATVYRVRVAGRFAPRALRYVVYAGARPIGYGTPSAHENAVIAVTADRAVLTANVTARYEDSGAARDSASGLRHGTAAAAAVRSLAAATAPGVQPAVKVTREEYNLGLQVYQPSGIKGKVELAADVHYPRDFPGGRTRSSCSCTATTRPATAAT